MPFLARHHKATVFVYLCLAELLVFGLISSHVGFYLDDWSTMCELRFGAPTLLGNIQSLLHDPKIIIRPVQALHYGVLYAICGTKPLWYHVANGLLEVLAAWLLYRCVDEVVDNRFLAFASAAIFLLYPIHDATHYWVLASSATLSIALYLGSLLLTVRAAKESKLSLLAVALMLFTISLFNYECFLPLALLNVVCAAFVLRHEPREAAAYAIGLLPAFGAGVGLYWVWSRLIVPHIAVGWVHSVAISPANIISTITRGTAVSIFPETWQFFAQQASQACAPLSMAGFVQLALLCGVTSIVACLFYSGNRIGSYKLVLTGALGVIALSFTIFGLNAEYEPTLWTIVNRINFGAAIGASALLAMVLMATAELVSRRNARLAPITAASLLSVLLAFFALASWGLSRPWTLSWVMQRHVADVLRQNKQVLNGTDTLMLVNCPRYVYWSPVFDGVWDFQSVAQITLDNPRIRGDVTSERLSLTAQGLTDISHGFNCGSFPFSNMMAIVAPASKVVPVHNAGEFVSLVRNEGLGFDLDKTMPDRWAQEIMLSSRNPGTF